MLGAIAHAARTPRAGFDEVARHKERHEDWSDYILPYKAALLDAIRDELRWSGSATAIGSWTSADEPRAREFAAAGVALEEITDPLLRQQVRLIQALKRMSQDRLDD